jgi:hypothetical protein
MQAGGPGPSPACLNAVNGVLTCTGGWAGDGMPVHCCGGMNEVIAQCANGSLFDAAVFILDRVDQDIQSNGTVPLMSLLGSCQRTPQYRLPFCLL